MGTSLEHKKHYATETDPQESPTFQGQTPCIRRDRSRERCLPQQALKAASLPSLRSLSLIELTDRAATQTRLYGWAAAGSVYQIP